MMKRLLTLLTITILLNGCLKSTTGGRESLQTTTSAPAPTLEHNPDPAAITFIYPQTIQQGDNLVVEVVNEGEIPYVFLESPDDNCLFVKSEERDLYIRPPETCDALAEIVLEPGQRRFFGSWDLFTCPDLDCLTREPASPGTYVFETRFYPYDDDGTLPIDEGIIQGGRFVIEKAAD